MTRFVRTLPFAAVAALAFAPCPEAQRTNASFQSPFVRLADQGSPRGFATASFDLNAYRVLETMHAERRVATIGDFPLPGGRSVDLVLRPVDVWEQGGTAVVIEADGKESRVAPSIRLFAAHVPGRASTAFLGISATMVHGYVTLEGETYLLSTGPDDGMLRPLAISHGDLFPQDAAGFCNVLEDAAGAATGPEQRVGLSIRETKVFVECDDKFRNRFSSNLATIDYATLLFGAASEIYRRDLGCTMYIPSGHIRVWNSTPGWGVITTFGDIASVRSWWNSPANSFGSVPRAQVHVLTYPVFGGVAQGVGILCNKASSYAISSCFGSFPYPVQHTSGSNWDLFVVAHEAGHLYGSQHTFDYVPTINCTDGTGPDSGTIMSYCHQSFGVGGVGMRFHPRVQDDMRADITAATCPNVIPISLGDYNADAVVDAQDLAAYDAYVAQGFASRGAFETFDMDGSGAIDAIDRQLLVGGGLPPASATVFNGSGANCPDCYGTVFAPILGTTWEAYVGGFFGSSILTTIVGYSNRLAPPISSKFGEILVGGPLLFTHSAMTNGQFAVHYIPFPFDIAFAGQTVPTQAILFTPNGPQAVNGLELRFSTY